MRDTLRSPRQIKLRKLLRDLREKSGLTQADVAARLDKPQSFVAKYEGGERRLPQVAVDAVDQERAQRDVRRPPGRDEGRDHQGEHHRQQARPQRHAGQSRFTRRA